MGTPEFAIPSLRILLENNYPIVGVVTQPDRPKGRGRILTPPPIKVFASAWNLHILQPENVKDAEFIEEVRRINPDLIVVNAFGQILPLALLEIPHLGSLNVHPSLLPKYRGAAPIHWALIRGEDVTGVTVMRMDEGMDTGDILMQEETPIGPEETFGELSERLSLMGASLLLRTLDTVVKGMEKRIPQSSHQASYAPRLKKSDCQIDWSSSARNIVNLVRGLSPEPSAYTFLSGKLLKILRASCSDEPVKEQPGMVVGETELGLRVAAKDRYVYVTEVQMENRKKMTIHEFLRGFRIPPGTVLGDGT